MKSLFFCVSLTIVIIQLTCGSTIIFGSGQSGVGVVRRSASNFLFGTRGRSNSGPNTNTNSNGRINFGDEPATTSASSASQKADEQFRKKMCATSTQGKDFLYHKKTGKCYQISGRGPCGENMAFYREGDSGVYGECDCAVNQGVPLVYHQKTDKCYFVYQQAYCQSGSWLAFNRRGEAMCERNKCASSRDKSGSWTANVKPDIVPYQGSGACVKLLSRNNAVCPSNQVVTFLDNHVWTSCGTLDIEIKHISPVGPLPCKPGSYRSVTGKCVPAIDWDF